MCWSPGENKTGMVLALMESIRVLQMSIIRPPSKTLLPLYTMHLEITSTYLFWTHASEGNASMCSEQYLEHIRVLLRFAD